MKTARKQTHSFPCFCFHNAYMLCYSLPLFFFLILCLQMYLVMLVSSAASIAYQFKSSCCDYWMSLTKRFYLFTASINCFWPPPTYKKLVWDSSTVPSLISGAMRFFSIHVSQVASFSSFLCLHVTPLCSSTVFPLLLQKSSVFSCHVEYPPCISPVNWHS